MRFPPHPPLPLTFPATPVRKFNFPQIVLTKSFKGPSRLLIADLRTMKKLVCSFAVLLPCPSGVYADPRGELTTIRAAASLTNAEASRHLPVSFEATVTYYRW